MHNKVKTNISKLCWLVLNLMLFSLFIHLSTASTLVNSGSDDAVTAEVKFKPSIIPEKWLLHISVKLEPIDDLIFTNQNLPKGMYIPKGTRAYRVVAKDISGKVIDSSYRIKNKFTIRLGYPGYIKTEKAINLKLFVLSGNRWLPLSSQVDTYHKMVKTEDTSQIGIYRLLAPLSNNMQDVLIYPNPVQFGIFGGVVKTLKFQNVPLGSVIEIYTVTGEKVQEIKGTNTTEVFWNGEKSNGDLVTSGLYLYRIQTAGGDTFGKIAVVR